MAKRYVKGTTKKAAEAASTKNYPYTTEDLAKELGMSLGSFRVWKIKAEADGKIKKPAQPSHLCIQDPESKNRLLYSEKYFESLKALRSDVKTRAKKGTSQSALKHAVMIVKVPVFDEKIAELLNKKFGNESGIEKFLREKLTESVKSALGKIEELKKKHEQEMKEALNSL